MTLANSRFDYVFDALNNVDDFFIEHPGAFVGIVVVIGIAMAWWFSAVVIAVEQKNKEGGDTND